MFFVIMPYHLAPSLPLGPAEPAVICQALIGVSAFLLRAFRAPKILVPYKIALDVPVSASEGLPFARFSLSAWP